MAMKVPTPVTSGAQQLGGTPYTPVQGGFFSLNYPTPPTPTFKGMQIQGAQIADLGKGLSSFGQQFQQYQDENGLLQIENNLYDLERKLYDPANGIGTQFGANASGLSDAVGGVLKEFMAENKLGTLSPSAQRAAEKMILGRSGTIMRNTENFERGQLVTHNTELLQSSLEQQIDRGIMGSDEEFSASIAHMDGTIDALASYMGWSPQKKAEQRQIYTTAAVVGRVNAMAVGTGTQSKDPGAAVNYLEDAYTNGLVDPETFSEAMATLKPAWIKQQALSEVGIATQIDWNERWDVQYGDIPGTSWQGYDTSAPTSTSTVAKHARSEAAAAAQRQQNGMSAQGYAGRNAIVSPNGTVATGPSPQLTQGTTQMFQGFQSSGLGGTLTIGSGYRSPQRQAELWDKHIKGWGKNAFNEWQADRKQLYAQYGPFKGAIMLGDKWRSRMQRSGRTASLAVPGTSNHNRGLAADINWNGQRLDKAPQAVQDWVLNNAPQYGLHVASASTPGMADEPWHVEVLGTRGTKGPASQMPVTPAQGGGVVYTPSGAQMGMYGGAKAGGGNWQPTLGTAHTANGGANHRDYSQLMREYTFEAKPGYIPVGNRNGRPVYAAPDYMRDADGNYVSVAAEDPTDIEHSAVHIAQKNGWLIPTVSNMKAVEAAAQASGGRVAMAPGDGNSKEWGAGNSTFTKKMQEALFAAGWDTTSPVFFAKELGIPDTLAEGTGPTPVPGQPQLNTQWAPGPNFPQGADGGKVGHILQRLIGSGIGITPEIAAGIVGSMMQESGPQLGEDLTNSIGAHGIAQWLGGRRSALQSFASSQGTTENNLDTQIDFILHELQGSEGGVLKALLGATTPEEASDIWTLQFERPGTHERFLSKRQAYARGVYGGGGTPQPSGYQHVPGQPGANNPYGMSGGAAYIYNMPAATADQREIRLAAMQGYQSEMAWIDQQQNRQQSQLIDTLTTQFYAAGTGSEFTDLVSPEQIQILGANLPAVQAIHAKIATGADNPGNPDLMWEMSKMFIDAAQSGDFSTVLGMWDDPQTKLHLRSTLSTAEMRTLDEQAKVAYAAQSDVAGVAAGGESTGAAATASAVAARIPSEARMTQVLTRQLNAAGITDQAQIDQLMPNLVTTTAGSLMALTKDFKGDVTGDIPLDAVADRVVTQLEVPMPGGFFGRLKMDKQTFGQVLQTIDLAYEEAGKTALDLIDAGVEVEGQDVPQDILEMIYDGYEESNPRAPRPSELLGLTVRYLDAQAPGGGLWLSDRLLPKKLGDPFPEPGAAEVLRTGPPRRGSAGPDRTLTPSDSSYDPTVDPIPPDMGYGFTPQY